MTATVKLSGWRKAEIREIRELTLSEYMGRGIHPLLVRATGPRHAGEYLEVRWSGEPKTWKRRPGDVERPMKYGMYESFHAGNFGSLPRVYTLA